MSWHFRCAKFSKIPQQTAAPISLLQFRPCTVEHVLCVCPWIILVLSCGLQWGKHVRNNLTILAAGIHLFNLFSSNVNCPKLFCGVHLFESCLGGKNSWVTKNRFCQQKQVLGKHVTLWLCSPWCCIVNIFKAIGFRNFNVCPLIVGVTSQWSLFGISQLRNEMWSLLFRSGGDKP